MRAKGVPPAAAPVLSPAPVVRTVMVLPLSVRTVVAVTTVVEMAGPGDEVWDWAEDCEREEEKGRDEELGAEL